MGCGLGRTFLVQLCDHFCAFCDGCMDLNYLSALLHISCDRTLKFFILKCQLASALRARFKGNAVCGVLAVPLGDHTGVGLVIRSLAVFPYQFPCTADKDITQVHCNGDTVRHFQDRAKLKHFKYAYNPLLIISNALICG